jgi:hypothetical protein
MARQRKKTRPIKPTKSPCLNGRMCEDHPNQPWGHRGCGAAGELCKNPKCDKDPGSIFSQSTVRYSPAEENRQLEKLHSTLNVSGKEAGTITARETAVCCVR